jgi:hypothetical protein
MVLILACATLIIVRDDRRSATVPGKSDTEAVSPTGNWMAPSRLSAVSRLQGRW